MDTPRYSYKFFDACIAVDLPLPELTAPSPHEPHIQISALQDTTSLEKKNIEWNRLLKTPDGVTWLAISRLKNGYLLRYPDIADFVISNNFKSIKYSITPEIPGEVFRHTLLNGILPGIFACNNQIILHSAAALLPNGKAVLFAGESGMGKSTLTAAFALSGASILTDDCLMLSDVDGRLLVTPSYPVIRLWDDSVDALILDGERINIGTHEREKTRVNIPNNSLSSTSCSSELASIYLLDKDPGNNTNSTIIKEVTPTSIFGDLMKQSFRLELPDPGRMKNEFILLSSLLHRFPHVYRLDYPREYSKLDSVLAAITDHASHL